MTTSSGRSVKSVVPFATDAALCMRALRSRMSAMPSPGRIASRAMGAMGVDRKCGLGGDNRRHNHADEANMVAPARAVASSSTPFATRSKSATRPHRGAAGVVRASGARARSDKDENDVVRSTSRALASAVVALCASGAMAMPSFAATEYVAELTPTKAGAGVSGTVSFALDKNRSNQELVVVTANVRGLTPGKHGINVHENGDVASCDDEGKCTGESYNPEKRPHHGPKALKKYGASASHFLGDGVVLNRHIGDLGNIVAEDDGSSTTKIKDLYTTLKPGAANSLAGRSVVIRAGVDDFETEADDGNAGPIVAYGAIVKKN